MQFDSLQKESIDLIIEKLLSELYGKLEDQKITLNVSDKVKSYLAEQGYDKLMGARPMERIFNDKIKKPLAEIVLFGDNTSKIAKKIDIDINEEGEIDITETELEPS